MNSKFKCTNISENGMTGLFWLGKDKLSVYDVLKYLNELYEENQYLQKMNELLIAEIQWNKEQRLKSKNKTLQITPKDYQNMKGDKDDK